MKLRTNQCMKFIEFMQKVGYKEKSLIKMLFYQDLLMNLLIEKLIYKKKY